MNATMRDSRRTPMAAILGLSIVVLLPSCGDDQAGRPKRYPASGRVLVDGKGRAGIQVRLVPVDRPRDVDALQPRGLTDAEGAYQLGTYEEHDGAPAGRYKVTLFWPDSPDSQSRPKDQFQGSYAKPESSASEFTIAEGDNSLADIAVALPKRPPASRPAGRRAPETGPNPDGPEAR